MLRTFIAGFADALGALLLAALAIPLGLGVIVGPFLLAISYSPWWLLLYGLEVCVWAGIDKVHNGY